MSGSFKSIPPSRNEPIAGKMFALPDFGVYDHGDAEAVWLTIAQSGSATAVEQPPPTAANAVTPPLFHLYALIPLIAPPFVKSLTIKRSPFEWTPLKPPLPSRLILFWKNQKPAVESPLFAKRSMPK